MTATRQITILPEEVTAIDMAFPARGVELAPPMDEIPEVYRDGHGEFSGFAGHWFFAGLGEGSAFHPRSGIDARKAFEHLNVIMGCYGLKHEHKEAAVDYLASMWFEAVVLDDKQWGTV